MNDTTTFQRIPNGLSVRKVIKAKDVEQTPEQRFRAHILGVVRVAVRAFEKDVIQIVREEVGIVLK